jgi:large subunit ribosomal protein L18
MVNGEWFGAGGMEEKKLKRIRRHKRIRNKVWGTKQRPRLCVYRSLANFQAQLIDDFNQKTLLSVSTQDKEFKKNKAFGGNLNAAKALGKILAERAKNKGITEVVFDRGGFLYHGRVASFAQSAREGGLKF